MVDFLRTRVAPWIAWFAAMGAAAWLWRDMDPGAARGFVESASYTVAAPLAGRVDTLAAAPGQRVRPGDPIATLDGREIATELEILAAEGRRIEAELAAVASETQVRVGEASRGIEESVDAADRAVQVARADRGVRAAEFAAMTAQLEVLQGLVDKRMADRRELDALAVKHAALKKELTSADATIAQLIAQAAAAKARRGGVPADATDRATEPLRAELAVVRQREELLKLRKESLVLRAPVAGEVSALHLRPGEIAAAGALVATIAPDTAESPLPARVFVCLGELEAAGRLTGEAVELHAAGGARLAAHIERLGPDVVQLPPRCWRDARTPEWGRAAYVAVDDKATLLPGQGFGVAFLGRRSPHADEAPRIASAAAAQAPAPAPTPATAPAPAEPTDLAVPPALLARSRFEPSALTWSPRLDRFVIASDDTGFENQNEHAPWLFTMDLRGRVDPEPLIVAGVDALNDIESIAPAPDGGLYVLASQSKSRKGKRSPARQRLVHVALAEGSARAAAVVQLARLLDGAGREGQAALGLAGTDDLDIEGMTVTREGGLLLGLKAPLGPRGALVWHLKQPEALLASGALAAGELTQWAQIPLTVTADGAPVGGGISELLELADGTWMISATASGLDPQTQDGALFHLTEKTAPPRRVRSFPGLKPEGLAQTGAALVVVFDTGAAPPKWMEQRWPEP